ncbi:cell wall synthase accessory phosphoprotein MacP [Streptococcus sciuri]|uniref:Cell wall synthase accessory phosphoprotein MacP n=1 Tax=Streptococcus sciuri TaxID=2973939 RepID=A0ABT2F6L0_9STRE|nr:cell wall synthase accessory phosphoprotein MacP [Streptococcus sciuri]MCS4488103.1 cell wall synthase accessory phosphoprotein MacP [Streptococcus sciuri]
MGTPLLTDDIIEKAKHNNLDDEDFQIDDASRPIYKSRKMEQERRKAFRRKLNIILGIVLLLIVALVYAVFNW